MFTEPTLATASSAENVFILMSQKLLPAVLAGVIMAGILAATISSSDSYLLIAASAVSKNIYEGIMKKNKRMNGEGSLRQLENGSWMCQLMVGHKPDGTRDIRTFVGKTQKEALHRRE